MATLPDEIRVRFVHDSLPTGVDVEIDGKGGIAPPDYQLDDADQDDHDVVMRSSMVAVEAVLNALDYKLDEHLSYVEIDQSVTVLRFYRRKGGER
jgi:hypothetical protein